MKKPLGRTTVAYRVYIASFITLINFLVNALVITRYSIKYIGLYKLGIYYSLCEIMAILISIDFGIGTQVMQYISKGDISEENHFEKTLYNIKIALTILAINSFVLTFVILISYRISIDLNFFTTHTITTFQEVLLPVSATLALGIFYHFLYLTLIALRNISAVAVLNPIAEIASIALAVSLLFNDFGISSLAYASILKYSISFLGIYLDFKKYLDKLKSIPIPKFKEILDKIKNSFPQFINSILEYSNNYTESLLVAIFIDPKFSAMFVITRKAITILKMQLDGFSVSTMSGFTNKFHQGDHENSFKLVRKIEKIFSVIALLLVTSYIAHNKSFVSLWVGKDIFAGTMVTTLSAIGYILQSYSLMYHLYLRCVGDTGIAIRNIFVEMFLKITLIAIFAPILHLNAIPLASIFSALVGIYLNKKDLLRLINTKYQHTELGISNLKILIYPILIISSAFYGEYYILDTWVSFILSSGTWFISLLVIIYIIYPELRSYFNLFKLLRDK